MNSNSPAEVAGKGHAEENSRALMGWGKAELELGGWLQHWASFAPLMPHSYPYLPQVGFVYLHSQVLWVPESNACLKSLWNHSVSKLEQELFSHQGSWPATPCIEEPHLYVGPGWRKGAPDLSLTSHQSWRMRNAGGLCVCWGGVGGMRGGVVRMSHPKICLSGSKHLLLLASCNDP